MRLYFSIFLIAITSLMFSCRATKTIAVRKPAMYNLTPDLDTILIVNRTSIEKGKGKQILNILEGAVSGEPILGDKYGSEGALNNLRNLIQNSDRLFYTGDGIIKATKSTVLDNDKPLSKEYIDSLCNAYGADGVIALEYFDSDSYYTQTNAYVRTFWRVYLKGESQPIIETRIQSSGSSYYYYSVIPPAYTSIARAGAQGSFFFYNQIVPPIVNESKYYYTGGSKEMKLAKKAFRKGDLDQAIYFWEVEAESITSEKIAGRAAYNLALAYEMQGDYNKALEWIDASIARGNTKAHTYKRILSIRKNEIDIVNRQMERE